MAVVPAGEAPGESAPAARGRRHRAGAVAAAHGIPLATIVTSVAVVAVTYLAGKLVYRLRDVVLMMAAAFIAVREIWQATAAPTAD